MITIGLAKPSESSQALIGFLFLFILATSVIIPDNLEFEKGSNVTTTYTYNPSGEITSSSQEIIYAYDKLDGTSAHNFGYWLAIASAVGFVGVIISLKKTNQGED